MKMKPLCCILMQRLRNPSSPTDSPYHHFKLSLAVITELSAAELEPSFACHKLPHRCQAARIS
jgi:hypothetical protein